MNTLLIVTINDKKTILIAGIILILATTACKTAILPVNVENETIAPAKKKYVSSFTRLFGNKNTNNKPWGTIEENGGSSMILQIKHLMKSKLWALLIWYTGVPHHALVGIIAQLVFQMTTRML
jgi:hypothetical protein